MKKYFLVILSFILFTPLSVFAADLYFMPPTLEIFNRENFLIQVVVDDEQGINAIDAEVFWDSDKLTLQAANNSGSIFDLWVKDLEVNQSGSIRLLAGATKAFSGRGGKVVDLIFTAKDSAGQVNLSFGADSKLLRADGQGSLADLKLFEVSYNILAKPKNLPVLTSTSMPDENKWYNSKIFDVQWQSQSGFKYSYLLSQDPVQAPDKVPEDILFDIKYDGLDDGIYYFHLLAQTAAGSWLPPVSRRVMIDTTVPETLEVERVAKDIGFGIGRSLVFYGRDIMSGIDHYELKETGGDWQTINSPYVYDLKFFSRELNLRAVDRAENYTSAIIIIPGFITLWWQLAFIILLLLLVIYFTYRIYAKKKGL